MPYATNDSVPADVKRRFTGRCLTVWREVWNETFERHNDEGRAFASAEKAGQNCKAAKSAEEPMDGALKFAGADTIEGLAIPFGGMFAGKDVDGEAFTPETDFCLDWFGPSGRPVLYDHGLDRALKTSVVGRQVEYEVRDEGIWAASQLDKAAKYRKAIDKLVEEGALGYSSGAMPHLAAKNARNEITRWPWVELSLTPIPAAGVLSSVHYVKAASFLEHIGDGASLSIAAVKAIAAGLAPDPSPDPETFDDKAGRVSAAIDEFREHALNAVAMRAKAGRVLSAANRERIARALESKSAVLAAFEDLENLLREADPEEAAKAADAYWAAVIEAEKTQSRFLGMEVTN